MHLRTIAKEPSAISGSTCHQTAFAGKPDINLWWVLAGFTLVKWFRGASIKPIMRSVFNCHFAAANCERVQTKEASLGERPAEQNGSRVPLSSILSCWTRHLPFHPSTFLNDWKKMLLTTRRGASAAECSLTQCHSNGFSLGFGQSHSQRLICLPSRSNISKSTANLERWAA